MIEHFQFIINFSKLSKHFAQVVFSTSNDFSNPVYNISGHFVGPLNMKIYTHYFRLNESKKF